MKEVKPMIQVVPWVNQGPSEATMKQYKKRATAARRRACTTAVIWTSLFVLGMAAGRCMTYCVMFL